MGQLMTAHICTYTHMRKAPSRLHGLTHTQVMEDEEDVQAYEAFER